MNWYKHISTLGFIGYLPMPGTCATLATLPVVYALNMYAVWWVQAIIISVIIVVGYYCVKKVLSQFEDPDPCCIVIDEVVGTLITFVGVQTNVVSVSLGFLLFRFFDISKPGLVRAVDNLPGIHGVMGDDIIAGIFAHILLRLCLYLL